MTSIHYSNPFATRYTRPDAQSFVFPEGVSAASIVATLRENAWWGQIIGPHGSGKSTLLRALFPSFRENGRRWWLITPKENDRAWPKAPSELGSLDETTLIIVDGYERLSKSARAEGIALARENRLGLLITAHRDEGFPHLFATSTTAELCWRLARRLAPDGDETVGEEDARTAFARHRGDIREALFELYDLYEHRRPRPDESQGSR